MNLCLKTGEIKESARELDSNCVFRLTPREFYDVALTQSAHLRSVPTPPLLSPAEAPPRAAVESVMSQGTWQGVRRWGFCSIPPSAPLRRGQCSMLEKNSSKGVCVLCVCRPLSFPPCLLGHDLWVVI